MRKLIVKLKTALGLAWVVRRCGFPYEQGYATCHPFKQLVLDTGLTREEAQARCDRLNGLK